MIQKIYKTCLVIPVYNEELNISLLFDEILQTKVYERVDQIIYIDDNSKDSSKNTITQLTKKYNKVKIITHSSNFGQSRCILSAAKYTENEIIITMDGDRQNNPQDIHQLLDIFFNDQDLGLVGGVRYKRKDDLFKIISSKIANFVRKKILKDDCDDTGCSLKVFKKEIFLQFPFFNGIHRFLPALFKGYGQKTLFIGVDHRKRDYGKSKYGIIDRLFKGILDIIRVWIILRNRNA